jgi:hypothetical protein
MEFFYKTHEDEVVSAIEDAVGDKLENLMMGAPGSGDFDQLFEEGDLSAVEDTFRKFLDAKEMDGQVPGVPTAASLRGVSHRMKNPYAHRASRPSFIDTGMYQANFRAWVEE